MRTKMGIMGVMGVLAVMSAAAHPGGTDANGGHNGPYGYHFHGGKKSKSSPTYAPTATLTPLIFDDEATNRTATVVATPERPKSHEELSEMRSRALVFRMEQATNGMPTAQYRLGMSYLAGTDGVKTNRVLGIYWLRKAADQGQDDAGREIARMVTNSLVLELPDSR